MHILQAAVIGACCVLSGWRLLHYFQLESYQLPGYFRTVKRNAQLAAEDAKADKDDDDDRREDEE